MKNILVKRIIVAIASVSLLFTTALFSGCDVGRNYDDEIADLQAQIDELKKEHEQFAAEHKEILDKMNGGETDGTTEEDTGSTTTTANSNTNNGTTAKNSSTTKKATTTTQATTTTTRDPDGFGSEVGM